ncbi:hypothetical protein SUGI_0853330 [Cryptomeria japonica]|nr:hypothetical protein SUGI_0853330 [Cryptomeria japonica]
MASLSIDKKKSASQVKEIKCSSTDYAFIKANCKLVLVGNGTDFGNSVERLENYVNDSIAGVAELDMNSTELVVDEEIRKEWRSRGHIDALVNCHAYEE